MLFDEETIFTYIGYAAALATILTFTIQILKIIETKNVTSLSSYMYIIYSLGLVCWATYGVYIENWLLVFANLLTFLCTFAILILIIYYDAEDKIERARRDPLTYVFNRKYFEQTVPVKIAEAKTVGQGFSVMMVDSSNLKNVIKANGIKAGNKLLKTLAKFLEKDLRENDLVSRFDDNKFAVFLYGADGKTVPFVAKRLLNNIKATKVKLSQGIEENIDINIGICTSDQGAYMEDLLVKAGKALDGISSKDTEKYKICEK
ncbi:MAG: diguanylate cyclase [Alphaproteobacteria bacterium]|nr:diguanylate cyclase [Alphaproteobacteria bacterium]